MGSCVEPEKPRLVEIGVVPEVWVDGIGKVEPLGGGAFRILLYRVRRSPDDERPAEHEVVAAILTSLAHASAAAVMLRALAAGEKTMLQ